ncbi:hypothetical protein D3C81_528580 [compost metagenome]
MGIDEGRIFCGEAGGHREQRSAVEHDAVDALVHQQAVQGPLRLTFGEEVGVAHLEGIGEIRRQALEEGGEARQAGGAEAGGQLQLEQPQLVVQGRQQLNEVRHLFVGAHQIALVADGLRELEAEAKVVGHRIGPAAHRFRGGGGVEGGVALHRIEHPGIVGEVLGRLGAHPQQLAGPGRV